MIENINAILTKNHLSATRSFVGAGSKREQRQWWKAYKQTFKDAPPPTKDHIQMIKECYERELTDNGIDDMTKNALLLMADDSPVFEAFKMLDAFFDFNATRRKRNELLIRQPPISKKQRGETNDMAPSKKPSEIRYNQFNNQLLQEFNKHRGLTKAIKENIRRAAVLLELYPSRHTIIEAMQAQEDDRGSNKKGLKIIPEWKFYDIVDSFSTPKTNRGINSVLVDKLCNHKYNIGEKHRLLVGYEARDENKEHPKELTESTVRRRIKEYL